MGSRPFGHHAIWGRARYHWTGTSDLAMRSLSVARDHRSTLVRLIQISCCVSCLLSHMPHRTSFRSLKTSHTNIQFSLIESTKSAKNHNRGLKGVAMPRRAFCGAGCQPRVACVCWAGVRMPCLRYDGADGKYGMRSSGGERAVRWRACRAVATILRVGGAYAGSRGHVETLAGHIISFAGPCRASSPGRFKYTLRIKWPWPFIRPFLYSSIYPN